MAAGVTAQAQVRGECSAPRVHVFDESHSGSGEIALGAITDPSFKQFVSSISSRLQAAAGCEYPDSEIIFLRRPLVASGEVAAKGLATVPSIVEGVSPSSRGRRLDTPWVKLVLSDAPKPSLRAAFIWNERQFLLDQALLAGASGTADAAPVPFSQDVFARLAQAYADTEIMPAAPEKRAQAEAESKSIPADLLWLFRHAWQSTRGPFSGIARSAMNETVEQVAGPYTAIMGDLIDRFMRSAESIEKLDDILALKSILPLGRYEIEKLR